MTAPTFTTRPATAGYTTLWGTTLEDHERALYTALNDPTATWPRRVEQERIPLREAQQMLLRMQASS